MRYNPLVIGMTNWALGLGSGDAWDGFWYNNKAASGSQLYPTGLSKYFDLHSVDGLISYTWKWAWDTIQELCLPLTFLIPIDVWLALFNNANLDGVWKVFLFYSPFSLLSAGIPSLWAWYFGIEMEDGWGILYN